MPRRNRGGDRMEYKHHGMKALWMLIVGLLVLANAYWGIVTWDYFIGGLLVLAGLVKLIMSPMKR